MSLSTLLSELFSNDETAAESPDTAPEGGENEPSATVVHECRNCGTNVSAGMTQCPACEGNDIVTYSIE